MHYYNKNKKQYFLDFATRPIKDTFELTHTVSTDKLDSISIYPISQADWLYNVFDTISKTCKTKYFIIELESVAQVADLDNEFISTFEKMHTDFCTCGYSVSPSVGVINIPETLLADSKFRYLSSSLIIGRTAALQKRFGALTNLWHKLDYLLRNTDIPSREANQLLLYMMYADPAFRIKSDSQQELSSFILDYHIYEADNKLIVDTETIDFLDPFVVNTLRDSLLF